MRVPPPNLVPHFFFRPGSDQLRKYPDRYLEVLRIIRCQHRGGAIMERVLFVAVFLLASSQSLTAQPKTRPSGFAGGFNPSTASRSTISPPAGPPARTSMPPPPAGISGGFGHPQSLASPATASRLPLLWHRARVWGMVVVLRLPSRDTGSGPRICPGEPAGSSSRTLR